MIVVIVWKVVLTATDDWYVVFARTRREAIRVVYAEHYKPSFSSVAEFCREYRPSVKQQSHRQHWAEGKQPGPWLSNTYEN